MSEQCSCSSCTFTRVKVDPLNPWNPDSEMLWLIVCFCLLTKPWPSDLSFWHYWHLLLLCAILSLEKLCRHYADFTVFALSLFARLLRALTVWDSVRAISEDGCTEMRYASWMAWLTMAGFRGKVPEGGGLECARDAGSWQLVLTLRVLALNTWCWLLDLLGVLALNSWCWLH